MKQLNILFAILISLATQAQDFTKNLTSARSAYTAGNLEDARFAMYHMLNDVDIIIGKVVIKILPTKIDAMASNPKSDNVTANTGLAGVVIHRYYGTAEKTS